MLEGQSFSLGYGKKYGADTVAAVLKFKQSAESDMFFFNNYTLQLSAKGVEPRQQTFHLKGMSGITLDKGYNLLTGRAVLQHYPGKAEPAEFRWLQLDFSEKDGHGNYKVKEFPHVFEHIMQAALKLTLFPMPPPGVLQFYRNLQNGDLHAGLFDKGNKSVTLFVQYDPAAKEMALLDKHKQRLTAQEMKPFLRPESLLPKKKVRSHTKGLSI